MNEDINIVGPTKDNFLEGNYMPYYGNFQADNGPLLKKVIARMPTVEIYELKTEANMKALVELFINLKNWAVVAVSSGSKKLLGVSPTEVKREGDESATSEYEYDMGLDDVGKIIQDITDDKSKKSMNKLEEFIQKTIFTPIKDSANKNGLISGSDGFSDKIPLSIRLLFASFSSEMHKKYKFRIISSPSIKVETGSGWRDSQSLLNSLFGHVSNLIKGGGADLPFSNSVPSFIGKHASNLASWANIDLFVGPYFQIADIVKGPKPSFSFTTILINDSSEAAEKNKEIVRNLTMGTLPGAQPLCIFKPSNLFNIKVNINIDDNVPIKKLFFCTANIQVESLGIYRDNITPEEYKITFTFTSLLPDYQNIQLLKVEDMMKTILMDISNPPKHDKNIKRDATTTTVTTTRLNGTKDGGTITTVKQGTGIKFYSDVPISENEMEPEGSPYHKATTSGISTEVDYNAQWAARDLKAKKEDLKQKKRQERIQKFKEFFRIK